MQEDELKQIERFLKALLEANPSPLNYGQLVEAEKALFNVQYLMEKAHAN